MSEQKRYEHCHLCDASTGRAGAGDGSLYDDMGSGPYCDDCWDARHADVDSEGKIKLKPCPLCGGEAHFDRDESGWEWIECSQCHVATNQSVSLMDDCKVGLAESWNRRNKKASAAEKMAMTR